MLGADGAASTVSAAGNAALAEVDGRVVARRVQTGEELAAGLIMPARFVTVVAWASPAGIRSATRSIWSRRRTRLRTWSRRTERRPRQSRRRTASGSFDAVGAHVTCHVRRISGIRSTLPRSAR